MSISFVGVCAMPMVLQWLLQKVTHLQNPLLQGAVRQFLRTPWIHPSVLNGKYAVDL